MAKKKGRPCECCGEEAVSTIQVYDTEGRLYLPDTDNMEFEKKSGVESHLRKLSLCHPCMRFVEDNFRAVIGYLKNEKGLKFRTEGPQPKMKENG